MNANVDPDERPMTSGPQRDAGSDDSFDDWAADMAAPQPEDKFGDLESMDSLSLDGEESVVDAVTDDVPVTGPRAHEIQFLADLAQLAAERVAAEAQVEADFQARTEQAERAVEQARQDFAAWLETDAKETVEEHAELRRAADARYERDSASNERGFAELKEKTTAELEPARKEAERLLNEARREADKQFDSRKHLAPRKLEEFQKQLEAWKVRISSDRDQAIKLLKGWKQPPPTMAPDAVSGMPTTGDLSTRMQQRVEFVGQQLAQLSHLSSPKLCKSWPLAIFWLVLVAAGAGAAFMLLEPDQGPIASGVVAVVGLLLAVAGRMLLKSSARSSIKELYPPLIAAAREVEEMVQGAGDKAKTQTADAQTKLIEWREQVQAKADQKHQAQVAQINAKTEQRLKAPTDKFEQLVAKLAARHDRDLKEAEATRARREKERLRKQDTEAAEIENRYRAQLDQVSQQRTADWESLAGHWQQSLAEAQAHSDQIRASGGEPTGDNSLSDWDYWAGDTWQPTERIPSAIRFGQFRVRMDQVPEGVPQNSQLAAVTPESFLLPAVMPFPDRASLLIKAKGNGRALAVETMQALMLRLLVTIPPSKLRFLIIDPVGLGENFAAFMHLADFNEAMVSNRIWTEPKHIEERLADISEHMENVIQKYLRNEFQSIEEYNRDAGEIAEPFKFLVIANYPTGFSDAAQRRLESIAASGARCGVYTIIMADSQVPLGSGFSLREFEKYATTLVWNHGRFLWKDPAFSQFELALDSPPPPAQVTAMLQTAGRYANEAGKVEVPFDVIAPTAAKRWTGSTAKGIDVPLGRAGATRLQSMKLGKGTSQHVLIGGKTGSGKSTLLHALITNAALIYSPDEIELYLIDFKQGVEFKTYVTHNLPHARIVAIESDREFGVSVLGRLDTEIKRRADRFRDLGVQDVNGYRKADPVNPLPRILMIVDEFQEFFTEDDKISQDASLLLDRLVRQGRAFGIHVLLGSQTLAGTSLPRSTISQMGVRIALQCSEGDAHLILSDENSAARLLTRPGEAIYNDSNGMLAGNHPFQVVFLPDERREIFLDQVHDMVKQRGFQSQPQIVFEGNVPADPADNKMLARLLSADRPTSIPQVADLWLGDAVAIKDPTCINFRAQSGSNLLIVGQNEEAALGILATALISLSAQHPAANTGIPRFFIFDGTGPGSPEAAALESLPGLTGDTVRLVPARELPAAVNEIAVEVERRQKTPGAELTPIFVFVHGIQKLRDLRKAEDDFGFSRAGANEPPNPGKQFASIVRDGPAWGIHTIVWCDGTNNLNRTFDRQLLRELEMRVVFQMSANDSSALIDTPLAGRLGANRGLFHSEEQGILEKFRPYRWPGEEWLAWVRERLGGGRAPSNGSAVPSEPEPVAVAPVAMAPSEEPAAKAAPSEAEFGGITQRGATQPGNGNGTSPHGDPAASGGRSQPLATASDDPAVPPDIADRQ